MTSYPLAANARSAEPLEDTRALYLELLKRALLGMLGSGPEIVPVPPSRNLLRRLVLNLLGRRGLTAARLVEPDPQAALEGRCWPRRADTMIGRKRLDNVQICVEDVLRNGIAGDLIEAGVWRGGASILMRGVLGAYQVDDRRVWAADSYEGLPAPDPDRYPADAGHSFHEYHELAVPLSSVRANFERYGLLDDQVRFVKGWFKDTLPELAGRPWAVIRLDGDLYQSTMDALKALYPTLSVGGYVIIDDYGDIPACRQAVTDYRREHGIEEEIRQIDWAGVFWQRTSEEHRHAAS